MFTGFIKETGIIEQVKIIDSGAKLTIKISSDLADEISLKSHIAIDGSVLTIVDKEDFPHFSFLKFYASNFQKVASYTPQKRAYQESDRFLVNTLEFSCLVSDIYEDITQRNE